ncbi:hypothetical protein SEA_RUDY_92 [Microbacterium phage Rudy]|nr:hypothetical protein SEA_RUDY_92 [Microbacterium phage Rudy]QWY80579.1 hypothetical protein SEA_QUAMMI_94 [Microbacterium phage Quammi]UVG33938.1 hypothetical protein SEA_VICEROY_93 [Microbacterium phage Viceroy]UVG35449.1 hypothetical protein SEA_ZAGIE_96 [Microbacterium phage Zagie]
MGKSARIKAQRGEFVRGQKQPTGTLSAKEARRKEREQDELIARLAASVKEEGRG